jgi:hypothetical protein
LLCSTLLTFLGKENIMNLYWLLAAVFFFGVVVGDAGRNFFGWKVDEDKDNDSGRDLEAEEERSNEHAYQRGLAQRAQVKRLVLENAQLRQRIDERFSENG